MTNLELCKLKALYKKEVDEEKHIFDLLNNKNDSRLDFDILFDGYMESIHRLEMFNLILECLDINYDGWDEE